MSGILIPPEVLAAEESRRAAERSAERAKRQAEHDERVRATIRAGLVSLARSLDGFEQTTHGALRLGDGIGEVLDRLRTCYEKPGAFSVSELVQVIERFANERGGSAVAPTG